MERLLCERNQCEESASKFCFNCKAFLCKVHRVEEKREQQENCMAEHYYLDAEDYWKNKQRYACLYCDEHSNEMRTRRCINCFHLACNSCPPIWCSKEAGRYHDYDMIEDIVGIYKYKVLECQKKLQQKHELFMFQLKETGQKITKTKSVFKEFCVKVDAAVESQIASIKEEGRKLKEELKHEESQITITLVSKIDDLEKKLENSKQLLDNIQRSLHTANGFMTMHCYSKLDEEEKDLIKFRWDDSEYVSFELIQGTAQQSLGLKLIKTERCPMDVADEPVLPVGSSSRIVETKCYPGKMQDFWGLCFLSAERIITRGRGRIAEECFMETIEGGISVSKTLHDSQVRQLLPYGDQVLALTYERNYWYHVQFLGTKDVLYEYNDFPLWYPQLMAIITKHQLMVLQRKTQTIHVVSFESKDAEEIELGLGAKVYGIMASSDGKLILLSKKQKKHSVVKYDPDQQQKIWTSDTLLEDCQAGRFPNRLNVAGYRNYLYVIWLEQATSVFRLSLSDGCVLQQIPCNELPRLVLNISLRGNSLAVAGYSKGIKFFTIDDMSALM